MISSGTLESVVSSRRFLSTDAFPRGPLRTPQAASGERRGGAGSACPSDAEGPGGRAGGSARRGTAPRPVSCPRLRSPSSLGFLGVFLFRGCSRVGLSRCGKQAAKTGVENKDVKLEKIRGGRGGVRKAGKMRSPEVRGQPSYWDCPAEPGGVFCRGGPGRRAVPSRGPRRLRGRRRSPGASELLHPVERTERLSVPGQGFRRPRQPYPEQEQESGRPSGTHLVFQGKRIRKTGERGDAGLGWAVGPA